MITPNGLHFERHHNGIPDINPEAHRLLIEKGLIKRMEVRHGYLDVMRLATSGQRA